MTNAFGGFLHTSPLSNLTSSTSEPPDPHAALASNCIRDYFGPVVQTIADALHARGPSTLLELTANIKHHCLRDWNQERGRLVDRLNRSVVNSSDDALEFRYRGSRVTMNKARGFESAGYITDTSHVRASLIVLLHHGLVKVSGGRQGGGQHGANKNRDLGGGDEIKHIPDPSSPQTHYTYTFLPGRAKLLPRYPLYVQHASTMFDDNASLLVEAALINGRVRGEDAILTVWEAAKAKMEAEKDDDDDDESSSSSDDEKNKEESEESIKALTNIVDSFKKLIEGGYIEMIKPIAKNYDLDNLQKRRGDEAHNDGIRGGEVEFEMNEDGTIVAEKKNKNGNSNKKKRSGSTSGDVEDEDGPKVKKSKVSISENGNGATSTTEQGKEDENHDDSYGSTQPHHPQILSLLKPHRKLIPEGSVYRANTSMFHTSLRAMVISRLVSEMYPDTSSDKAASAKKESDGGDNGSSASNNMKYAGAIVKAALTYAARQEHAPLERILGIEESEEERHHRMAEWGTFCPADIIPYLPAEVTKTLKSQVGGLNQNLSTLLVHMSTLQYPPIVLEVEEALGHPQGGKFEVCTRQLLQRMRDRIVHRVLTTHHGLTAARIVSILGMKGHCESDALAEDAMVPSKEAREILHRLHREKYINMFDMHMTKTHNTGTAIFLWDVMPQRLLKTVVNNVCLGLLNLRLRRQHEVEVGKDWMDRAKEASAAEENVHEEDKRKYHAFCKGLERLDCASLQLDETLMVLKDF